MSTELSSSVVPSAPLPASARSTFFSRGVLLGDTALVAYIALTSFIAHMLVANNYGYFRDELYYMAAGRHLAAGYVDFPPFIALLAALLRVPFNDNLIAIHVLPAVASALVIFTAGMMTRELGGGRVAQMLAALATLVNITYLATGSIFSYDAFDELWWALAAYVVIRLLRRNQPRLWLLFGLIAGIGLTTKLSMLFFGFALVVGLLLTPARVAFRSRWIWLGGLIAFAFLVPYTIWNAANGWPTLAFWSNYGDRLVGSNALTFLAEQIYTANPLTLPLWITGLYFFLRAKDGRPYRALGWTYLVLFVIFAYWHAKTYFLAPAYPFLYAGGAIIFARAYERAKQRQRRRWGLPTYAVALVLSGLLLAPVAMPILPPPTFGHVYGFLGGDAGAQMENHATGTLPQWLGDRYGWTELTATVAKVYRSLPADEQQQACISTDNYGEAGALEYLGTAYHLPPVLSGHNNYFFWGPGNCTGKVLIVVTADPTQIHAVYASVQQVATTSCVYCMPYEDGVPIYVCTQPTFSNLRDVWPGIKHFN
ncbi:MAG: hypothetical protein OJF49_001894 [Ktedonobacterales bacterium]|jgi:hypothetical protein|nr:MAG: hypothetical protein OJF49_001894 [Ktedonobacterales bacterium]